MVGRADGALLPLSARLDLHSLGRYVAYERLLRESESINKRERGGQEVGELKARVSEWVSDSLGFEGDTVVVFIERVCVRCAQ